jgi:hypothetical protein
VAYNFQTGKKKIKLLTEYENVIQKVLVVGLKQRCQIKIF